MSDEPSSEGEKPASAGTRKLRAKILKTALKIFAREGFHNADVQVIADLAGVGKGTIYRHFGNKHEFFLATARASVEWQAEYVGKAVQNCDGIANLLRGIAIACGEYYGKNPEAVEIMIQERAEFRKSVFPTVLMFRSNSVNSLELQFGEAVRNGEFRPVDPACAANAFLDLLYGCAVCGCLGGSRNTLVRRFKDEVEIFLSGLLPTAS